VQRLVRDLYRMLDEINSEDVPVDLKVAESYDDFIWDTKNNDYDLKSFAMRLKATVSSDANVLLPPTTNTCLYMDVSKH
jgi:alpha-1,4-galacturonosyltransferase